MKDIQDECARKATQIPQTLFFNVLVCTRKSDIQEMVAALIAQLSNSNGRATITHVLKKAKWGVPYKELQMTVSKPAPVRTPPPPPPPRQKSIWELTDKEFQAWMDGRSTPDRDSIW